MKILPLKFYNRPTLEVARELLGRILVVSVRGRSYSGHIVETEAYIGEDDPACHARRGRTPRTQVMYGPPGRSFVYFTYGNHWMFNCVTEREGFPAAVLIRAIEPLEGVTSMRRRRRVGSDRDLTNGPGKLTQALGITGRDNDLRLDGPRLIIGGPAISNLPIAVTGRVGVDEGSDYPWRFTVEGNPWVSAYRRGGKRRKTVVP